MVIPSKVNPKQEISFLFQTNPPGGKSVILLLFSNMGVVVAGQYSKDGEVDI